MRDARKISRKTKVPTDGCSAPSSPGRCPHLQLPFVCAGSSRAGGGHIPGRAGVGSSSCGLGGGYTDVPHKTLPAFLSEALPDETLEEKGWLTAPSEDRGRFPLVSLSLTTVFLQCPCNAGLWFSRLCFDLSVCHCFKRLLGCDFLVILDIHFPSHFCISPRTPPNRGRQVAGGVPGWGRRGLGKERGWGTKPAPSDPALQWFGLYAQHPGSCHVTPPPSFFLAETPGGGIPAPLRRREARRAAEGARAGASQVRSPWGPQGLGAREAAGLWGSRLPRSGSGRARPRDPRPQFPWVGRRQRSRRAAWSRIRPGPRGRGRAPRNLAGVGAEALGARPAQPAWEAAPPRSRAAAGLTPPRMPGAFCPGDLASQPCPRLSVIKP